MAIVNRQGVGDLWDRFCGSYHNGQEFRVSWSGNVIMAEAVMPEPEDIHTQRPTTEDALLIFKELLQRYGDDCFTQKILDFKNANSTMIVYGEVQSGKGFFQMIMLFHGLYVMEMDAMVHVGDNKLEPLFQILSRDYHEFHEAVFKICSELGIGHTPYQFDYTVAGNSNKLKRAERSTRPGNRKTGCRRNVKL